MPPRSRTAAVSASLVMAARNRLWQAQGLRKTQRRQRVMPTAGRDSRTQTRAGSTVMLN